MKMGIMKTKVLYAALLFLPLLFTSCKKEDLSELKTGQVAMRMMKDSAACDFEEVNLDVRGVEVRIGGSTGGDWYKLNTNAGIYNIITLSNANAILLADQEIPTGEIMAVRLVLGPQNSLRKNGILYPVNIAPEDKAGLEAEVFGMIGDSKLNLRLEVCASQSVMQDAQHYRLKPVIKAYTERLQ
jgi:hypothetical protein